jgi:hypothetical protein
MKKRRRFKQIMRLKDRLALFAKDARKRAEDMPPGPAKEDLLRKAQQAETATHLDEWVNSPGLRPPTLGEPYLWSDNRNCAYPFSVKLMPPVPSHPKPEVDPQGWRLQRAPPAGAV